MGIGGFFKPRFKMHKLVTFYGEELKLREI
jgi:hypothetical protein